MRKSIVIQEVYNPETSKQYKVLLIDGEVFDWGVEIDDLKKAKSFCRNDSYLTKSVCGDICHHFLKSLSEFLNQEITLAEVNEALEQGHIECS